MGNIFIWSFIIWDSLVKRSRIFRFILGFLKPTSWHAQREWIKEGENIEEILIKIT